MSVIKMNKHKDQFWNYNPFFIMIEETAIKFVIIVLFFSFFFSSSSSFCCCFFFYVGKHKVWPECGESSFVCSTVAATSLNAVFFSENRPDIKKTTPERK